LTPRACSTSAAVLSVGYHYHMLLRREVKGALVAIRYDKPG
jgi:hypothetical protein